MAEGEAGAPEGGQQSAEMQAYLARLEHGQNELRQGISYLAQVQAAQAQAAQAPPPAAPQIPANANERLRQQLWEDPLSVFAQVAQIQDQKTEQRLRKEMTEAQQVAAAQAAHQDFWFGPRGFYATNPDISDIYHDTVQRFFGAVPAHITDPSARANQAAEWFRQQRQSELETMREQERRKNQQASTVATGTGGTAADFPRQFNPSAEAYDPRERAEAYAEQRRKQLAGTQSLGRKKVA
jgi:hypothetical protein